MEGIIQLRRIRTGLYSSSNGVLQSEATTLNSKSGRALIDERQLLIK